jgi:hypothetical protein
MLLILVLVLVLISVLILVLVLVLVLVLISVLISVLVLVLVLVLILVLILVLVLVQHQDHWGLGVRVDAPGARVVAVEAAAVGFFPVFSVFPVQNKNQTIPNFPQHATRHYAQTRANFLYKHPALFDLPFRDRGR